MHKSVCASVLLARLVLAAPVASEDGFAFNRYGVGLADVHAVLFGLKLLVVTLFVVFALAVVRGGVTGQSRRRRHRGWSRVAET